MSKNEEVQATDVFETEYGCKFGFVDGRLTPLNDVAISVLHMIKQASSRLGSRIYKPRTLSLDPCKDRMSKVEIMIQSSPICYPKLQRCE